ncbi:MAG: hypothetical protein HQ569_07625 [Actinobacteria bacterium]|nr:hypothetical protein [Actinomycetota bacterium]
MIFYRPIDGDAHTTNIKFKPKTCFIMTQFKEPIPTAVSIIEAKLKESLNNKSFKYFDANSIVTGKDFLMKIWKLILEVPLGIAIIDGEMPPQTLANIFYEIGILQSYGKETLIIKSKNTKIPSDFIRTEYIEFDESFEEKINKFFKSLLEQAEHFEIMAEQLEKNPLLAIDYIRRAYLLTGNSKLIAKKDKLREQITMKNRAKNSVEMLLVDFH